MRIGNVSLKNQFIMAPVKTGYSTKEGIVTKKHLNFYRRRAKHVAAITPEPFFMDSRVKELPTQIGIESDNKISGLKELTDVIHQEGAKAIAHLNHPGRMANPNLPTNIFLSSSNQACENGGPVPKAMEKEDIYETIETFKNAAIRAEKSDFDFIELQFGHGYLIAQYLSPKVNSRIDEYGGSFENRIRLGLEIFEAVKSAVSIPIIVRISGSEMINDGIELDEMIKLSKILENKGAAAIHVSAGSACSTPAWYFQHMAIPKGKTWDMAAEVRKNISIPVITVGQINEFIDIDRILNEQLADYIAVGRPMIADPDFIGKYLKQVDELLRPCSACLDGCLGGVKSGKGLMCAINPLVGQEDEELVERAEESQSFAVVGGGLAGMEAAITLKNRGHEVVIFEKNNELGGQFNLASLPPNKKDLSKATNYLERLLDDLNIKVENKEVYSEDLIGKFDKVMLASGSEAFVPPIEGLKDYYWAEIMKEENMPKGKKVLVIGGGLIGIEVAEKIVASGNKVVIVEMLDEIARGMELISKKLALTSLEKNRVKIYTNTKVEKIDRDKAYIKSEVGKEIITGFDMFVVTTGMRSNKSLANELEGKIPYYLIGDAKQVGKQIDAIQTAFFTSKEL